MATHSVEISVRGPEGVMATKTYDTNETGAKELVQRFDRGVASHRILEGIEDVDSESRERGARGEAIGGAPNQKETTKPADKKKAAK